ncbi:YceI family protein [Pedobacter immunditicola]|uniref:YceI family protein n=1 Tax=Pedobacter immunditicola TaxID=3133440 RepID=UPI0030B7C387
MKSLIFLFLALTLTSFSKVHQLVAVNKSSKWVISENSSLVVNGSTNVNKFSCSIRQYPKTDTVLITDDQKSKVLLSGELNIDVKNFDCNNLIMTKQLRKTLKEDQFPTFQIRFLSLKETSFLKQKKDIVKGLVEIEIAGVTKRFEISYQLSKDKNTMLFTGRQPINFSDFKLVPPRKMGKLIQAKDQLVVVFLLKMEAAS